jgi:hypothetical protein
VVLCLSSSGREAQGGWEGESGENKNKVFQIPPGRLLKTKQEQEQNKTTTKKTKKKQKKTKKKKKKQKKTKKKQKKTKKCV